MSSLQQQQEVVSSPSTAAAMPTTDVDKISPPSTSRIEWLQTLELDYALPSIHQQRQACCCFHCGSVPPGETRLLKCSKCHVASYCQKQCQMTDWKTGGHKRTCQQYARIGPAQDFIPSTSALMEGGGSADNNGNSDHNHNFVAANNKELARNGIITRFRFYICPYAVYKTAELGRGFLFLQFNETLSTMALPQMKDCYGRALQQTRSVMVHFLTLGEFDMELCRDDFEFAHVQNALHENRRIVRRPNAGHRIGQVPLWTHRVGPGRALAGLRRLL